MRKGHVVPVQDQLRVRLEAKGWSHSRLAEEVGITRSAVSHILAGRKQPSLQLACRLYFALGLPVEAWLSAAA